MNVDHGEPNPEDVRRRMQQSWPAGVIQAQHEHLYEECCALRKRNAFLAERLMAAYERIAGQQELLSRKAERCEDS